MGKAEFWRSFVLWRQREVASGEVEIISGLRLSHSMLRKVVQLLHLNLPSLLLLLVNIDKDFIKPGVTLAKWR